MTRLFLLITLVLPLLIDRYQSLKLNEDEVDEFNSVLFNSGVKYPIDFKPIRPLDNSESDVSSYSGVKWSKTPLTSEFLEQNYDLKSSKFDLDSSSINTMNILFGTESNLWITGSTLKRLDLVNDIMVDNSKPGSKLFINKFSPNIVIISDPIGKVINLSKSNGKSSYVKTTPFRPDQLYFTPDETTILGVEAVNQNTYDLWITLDFGENWINLGKCDKFAPEWEKSKGGSSIYYIDGNQQLVKLNLNDLESNQDVSTHTKVMRTDVREFELADNRFLFATSLNDDMVLQILNLKNPATEKNEFVKATFKFDQTPDRIMDYNVVWADDSEILVAVYYDLNDKLRADLFRTTDFKKFSFELTLKNLVYNDKKFDLEVKILNKRGGVILANVHTDENDYRLVKTMSRIASDSNWNDIKMSPELKESHLDLNSPKFMFSHEYENSLIEDPKSPDFAITAVMGKNGEKLGIYKSQGDASEWTELTKGAHTSAYSNFGHILLSVDQSQPVDELIFTLNKGFEWYRMKFSDEAVRVNELLTVSPTHQDQQPRFILVATNAKTGARILFKIDAVRQQVNSEQQSLPPDVSLELPDECLQKCYDKLAPNQLICVRTEMICNGVVECFNGMDESNCKVDEEKESSSSSEEENEKTMIKDTNLYKSQIPAAKRLGSIKTISTIKLRVIDEKFLKSTFSLTYSLDAEPKSTPSRRRMKTIYTHQVAVYRIQQSDTQDTQGVDIDDSTLETKGEIIHVFEQQSHKLGADKTTIQVENLEPGYVYVCLVFINFDGARAKTFKLADRLVFTDKELISHVELKASKTDRYIKIGLIVLVVFVTLLVVLTFILLTLYRCCLSRRRSRNNALENLKYHPIRPRGIIFRSNHHVVADNQMPLTNNAFIEDGVYNSPNV